MKNANNDETTVLLVVLIVGCLCLLVIGGAAFAAWWFLFKNPAPAPAPQSIVGPTAQTVVVERPHIVHRPSELPFQPRMRRTGMALCFAALRGEARCGEPDCA